MEISYNNFLLIKSFAFLALSEGCFKILIMLYSRCFFHVYPLITSVILFFSTIHNERLKLNSKRDVRIKKYEE